jgi:hypothetical protein
MRRWWVASQVVAEDFLQRRAPRVRRAVRTRLHELEIVYDLNAAVAAHGSIQFGSYPVSEGEVQTVLTLEANGQARAPLPTAAQPRSARVVAARRGCVLRFTPRLRRAGSARRGAARPARRAPRRRGGRGDDSWRL